jgi:molecular chaperone GrpE
MSDELQTGDTVETTSVEDIQDPLATLVAERDQLAQEKADLEERLLRQRAEFDNARRRAEREKQEWVEYSGMTTIRALLPVIDDLERALKAATAAETANTDFLKGIELIYQRMMDSLQKLGLEPIATENQQFDPHVHEAVDRVQNDELEDHTIVAEYQRGYNFKGKLLRPAMVKVSVKS